MNAMDISSIQHDPKHLGVINCPVCPVKDIPADRLICENCGTDLAPIRRIRELTALHYNAALMFAGRDDYPAAIRELQAALSADPSSAPIRVLLGKVLWKTGRTREALDEWHCVVGEHPDDVNAQALLTQARHTRSQQLRTLPIVAALGAIAIAVLSFTVGRMTGDGYIPPSQPSNTPSVAAMPEPPMQAASTDTTTVTVSRVSSELSDTAITITKMSDTENVTPSKILNVTDTSIAIPTQPPTLPNAENKTSAVAPEGISESSATPKTADGDGQVTAPETPSIPDVVSVPNSPLVATPETNPTAAAANSKVISDLLTTLGAIEGLRIERLNDAIRVIPVEGLFPSGSIEPFPRSAILLRSIADALKAVTDPVRVRVVGFTDIVPPQPGGRWVENWRLALYRATGAVAAMRDEVNRHEWFASIGDERHTPCPNDSDVNRRCNRTVIVEIRAVNDSW